MSSLNEWIILKTTYLLFEECLLEQFEEPQLFTIFYFNPKESQHPNNLDHKHINEFAIDNVLNKFHSSKCCTILACLLFNITIFLNSDCIMIFVQGFE